VSAEPGDDELAAIAAAYAIVVGARRPADAAPPSVSRWRRAGRVDPAGAPAARGNGRRSAWRAATGP
jgi:hypothetical protein